MKEELYQYIVNQSGSMSIPEIVIGFVAAVIIGTIIFISYRFSHTSSVYSAKFNVSLVMLTLVTTLVMSVIGNNVALSLGMVGALSIVRFRTAIKDPRDTAYIFWGIAIGICCGVADYAVAIIGTVFIFVLLVVFGMVQDNQRYLLVIRAGREKEKEIVKAVNDFYGNKAELRVNNSTVETTEFIYELSQKLINQTKEKGSITEILYGIESVASVNVVAQNDEMR